MSTREQMDDGSIRISGGPPVEPKTVAMMCNSVGVQTLQNATITQLDRWLYRYSHPDIVFAAGGSFTLWRAGLYNIGVQAMYRNGISSNGVRALAIRHNGNEIAQTYTAPVAAQNDYVTVTTICDHDCGSGTVITFHGYHTAGGPVDLHPGHWTRCWIRRVGPMP